MLSAYGHRLVLFYPGCLREGAKSYVKRLRPERGSAPGQRYFLRSS